MEPLIRLFQRNDLTSIQDIFWACSSADRSSIDEDIFFQTWCGAYIESEFCFTLCADLEGDVVGYCVCSFDSEYFFQKNLLKSHLLFSDEYSAYPCHLHINVAPNFHGKGIGRLLMKAIFDKLKQRKKEGVFIITDPESSNVRFYTRLGFKRKLMASQDGTNVLFMGCRIY